MTTLVTTVTETLRYRGKLGQWAWVLHRVSGLGVLLFLVIHVIDTSWVYFFPELYEEAIKIYQTPLFTIGEFALAAGLIYHSFNGLRIVILDARPQWWQYQGQATQLVFAAAVVVLAPTFLLMGQHALEFYSLPEHSFADLKLGQMFAEVALPFGGGMILVLIAGAVASLVLDGVVGSAEAASQRSPQRSRFEQAMWSFMRLSGLLLIFLAIGHFMLMHVINGVFEINELQRGTAAAFVAERWESIFWRVYDGLLLLLATIHGMNGLRYVIGDYLKDLRIKRGLNWAIAVGTGVMIVMGGIALLAFDANEARGQIENLEEGNSAAVEDGDADDAGAADDAAGNAEDNAAEDTEAGSENSDESE